MDTVKTSHSRPLLEVRNLSKHFGVRQGPFSGSGPVLAAVDQVSFNIERGQVFGLVGESGSGKSTLGRTILQLVAADSGRVLFKGRDLGRMDRRELKKARQKIQMIFQDPAGALSPRRTILQTLTEPMDQFGIGARGTRRDLAVEALLTVGMDSSVLPRLPHQFSSGQRQRISIARALLTHPELVIADEAVSALDVSVQAQILELVLQLQKDRGIAFLFISHDLAVIQQVADVAGVMYRGQLVEIAPREALFSNPLHPYTRQLLSAVPDPDPAVRREVNFPVAGLARLPMGSACVFAHRCPQATSLCRETGPLDSHPGPGREHRVKCHLYTVDQTGT